MAAIGSGDMAAFQQFMTDQRVMAAAQTASAGLREPVLTAKPLDRLLDRPTLDVGFNESLRASPSAARSDLLISSAWKSTPTGLEWAPSAPPAGQFAPAAWGGGESPPPKPVSYGTLLIPDPVAIVKTNKWPRGIEWTLQKQIGWLNTIMAPYTHVKYYMDKLAQAQGLLYEFYAQGAPNRPL